MVLSKVCARAQRVLLLSYDAAARRIAFRHYAISAQPSGVSRGVKALVARRQLPDMGAMADVAEFLTKGGYGSVRAHVLVTCCELHGHGSINPHKRQKIAEAS